VRQERYDSLPDCGNHPLIVALLAFHGYASIDFLPFSSSACLEVRVHAGAQLLLLGFLRSSLDILPHDSIRA
jgi:hypothetical protein